MYVDDIVQDPPRFVAYVLNETDRLRVEEHGLHIKDASHRVELFVLFLPAHADKLQELVNALREED